MRRIHSVVRAGVKTYARGLHQSDFMRIQRSQKWEPVAPFDRHRIARLKATFTKRTQVLGHHRRKFQSNLASTEKLAGAGSPGST